MDKFGFWMSGFQTSTVPGPSPLELSRCFLGVSMFFILSRPRSMLPNTLRLFLLEFNDGFSGVAKTQSSFLTLAPRRIGVLSRPLSTERDGDRGLLVDIALENNKGQSKCSNV